MSLESLVSKALKALGDDEGAVGESLFQFGCKGVRKSEDFCPVANRVKQLVPLDTERGDWLCVDGERVSFCVDSVQYNVYTTDAVEDFVKAFDRGGYPDLAISNP